MQKKFRRIVTLLIAVMFLFISSLSAFAATIGYVTLKDGKNYEYSLADLADSYDYFRVVPESPQAALYRHFAESQTVAEVDPEKGYLEINALAEAYDAGILEEYKAGTPEVLPGETLVSKVTCDQEGNITIGEEKPITPPMVESVSVINATTIEVTFEGIEDPVTFELEETLVHGENEVTFEYYGIEYIVTVFYEAPVASTYAFSYEVPADVVAGTEVIVLVTFATDVKGDFGYDGVRFQFAAGGPGDVTFTATDSEGQVHTFTNAGYWGPAGGFELPAEYEATTDWTLNFAVPGEYTITFKLVDITNEDAVIAEGSATVNVQPATAPGTLTLEGPEEATASTELVYYTLRWDGEEGALYGSVLSWKVTKDGEEIDSWQYTYEDAKAADKTWIDEITGDICASESERYREPGTYVLTGTLSHPTGWEVTVTKTVTVKLDPLQQVIDGYSISADYEDGTITAVFDNYLDELPEGIEDYEIDVLITLGQTLPEGTEIAVTYNGNNVPVRDDWRDNFNEANQIWLGEGILDIGGAKPFTGGAPGNWAITISGNEEDINTTVTIESSISDDNFTTWTVIADAKVTISLFVGVAEIYHKPSGIGMFTEEVKVKVDGEFIIDYTIGFDGIYDSIIPDDNGISTVISSLLNDLSKVRVVYNGRILSVVDGGLW